jgi:arginyl-tRNA synthetase
MNVIVNLKQLLLKKIKELYSINDDVLALVSFKINEKQSAFGDVSCNAAMVIAKEAKANPRTIALQLQEFLQSKELADTVVRVDIAGPGFLNITITHDAWVTIFASLYKNIKKFLGNETAVEKKRFLIEFVSANPTGPLHLGHGRGAIVGDVLSKVLTFLGHHVTKEFYINDAGNQVRLLGLSFKARCFQALGSAMEIPEGGYHGEYLQNVAADCVAVYGEALLEKSDLFFQEYAIENMLNLIKADLQAYGISFDVWFSEKSLHDDGSLERAIELLQSKNLLYEQEGALWFRATDFGDDKDRVIKKSNGEMTYIAPDIAYHKNKFERGFDVLINIWGHDHHGYVKRLKATLKALGFDDEKIHVILCQIVHIKNEGKAVKMSKRAGTMIMLSDIINEVGQDVARFFYLNCNVDSPLTFDLALALQQTDENPVHYIHYAYVRINSILKKAQESGFGSWIDVVSSGVLSQDDFERIKPLLGAGEISVIKYLIGLADVLKNIESTYQTQMLSQYALDLARCLHAYYAENRIIDSEKPDVTQVRLFTVLMVHKTLDVCLELLGLSKPEKM